MTVAMTLSYIVIKGIVTETSSHVTVTVTVTVTVSVTVYL
jgi:hypothetical protein